MHPCEGIVSLGEFGFELQGALCGLARLAIAIGELIGLFRVVPGVQRVGACETGSGQRIRRIDGKRLLVVIDRPSKVFFGLPLFEKARLQVEAISFGVVAATLCR